MDDLEFKRYISNIVNLGDIKQTGLYVFDALDNFKLSSNNKFLIEDITDLYMNFISSLEQLEEYKTPFLKSLKEEEIKSNQALESISPFLIQVFMNSNHKSATNFAIRDKLNGRNCTINNLCKYHKILLNGLATSIEEESKYRTDNNTFVGSFSISPLTGEISSIKNVSYLPIDYKDIKVALDKILKLYNKKDILELSDIFVNPIIIHGLLAALQCFRDGNTRLSRVLEHVSIWDLANKYLENSYVELPVIYSSDAIIRLNKRGVYRNLIKEFAVNPSTAIFNEWITFNMLLFEKQIYYNQDRLGETMSVLKKVKK